MSTPPVKDGIGLGGQFMPDTAIVKQSSEQVKQWLFDQICQRNGLNPAHLDYQVVPENSHVTLTARTTSRDGEDGIYHGTVNVPYQKASFDQFFPNVEIPGKPAVFTIYAPLMISFREFSTLVERTCGLRLEPSDVKLSVVGTGLVNGVVTFNDWDDTLDFSYVSDGIGNQTWLERQVYITPADTSVRFHGERITLNVIDNDRQVRGVSLVNNNGYLWRTSIDRAWRKVAGFDENQPVSTLLPNFFQSDWKTLFVEQIYRSTGFDFPVDYIGESPINRVTGAGNGRLYTLATFAESTNDGSRIPVTGRIAVYVDIIALNDITNSPLHFRTTDSLSVTSLFLQLQSSFGIRFMDGEVGLVFNASDPVSAPLTRSDEIALENYTGPAYFKAVTDDTNRRWLPDSVLPIVFVSNPS